MSYERQFLQEVRPSSARLIGYRFEKVEFRLKKDDENSGDHEIELSVRISMKDGVEAGEGGDVLRRMTLETSVNPKPGNSFYSILISITGVFASNAKEEDAIAAIRSTGARELYSIAQSMSRTLTSDGEFGTFVFPSIEISGKFAISEQHGEKPVKA